MPQIIRKDTTWESGSVINLKRDVQIAAGATLTIEDGVKVRGNGHDIQVWGTLNAGAARGKETVLERVDLGYFGEYDSPGHISLNDVRFLRGSFIDAGSEYGSFDVRNSHFFKTDGFYIWYPQGKSVFRGNIFEECETISAGVDRDMKLTIEGNVFARTKIENWAAYDGADSMVVRHNNFLDLPNVALQLEYGYDNAAMYAVENYFGTTNKKEVGRRVLDARDSLWYADVIDVSNPLFEPHEDSPVFYYSWNSTAYGNAGDNKLVASDGDDRLLGFSGKDKLYGRASDDLLFGHAGADVLAGGAGDDILNGGGGRDTFVFSSGSGRDVVIRFQDDNETHDFVNLQDLDGVGGFRDLIDHHVSEIDGKVVISSGEDQIILRGAEVSNLTKEMFLI